MLFIKLIVLNISLLSDKKFKISLYNRICSDRVYRASGMTTLSGILLI